MIYTYLRMYLIIYIIYFPKNIWECIHEELHVPVNHVRLGDGVAYCSFFFLCYCQVFKLHKIIHIMIVYI